MTGSPGQRGPMSSKSSNGSIPELVQAAIAAVNGSDRRARAQALTDLAVHLVAASHTAETTGDGSPPALRHLAARCQRAATGFLTDSTNRNGHDLAARDNAR